MNASREGLRQIKAFASGAGVSVRTLHLYDRLGLLKPAAVTPAGYRLYGEAELARLEQIVALRFIGFGLDKIKELLEGSAEPLAEALRIQRAVIGRQKARLESALAAIDRAQRDLAAGDAADRWEILRTVIEVFKMQNDWKWVEQYYSPEALEELAKRGREISMEVIEQGQRDWMALIAEVEKAVAQGVDPASATAQALAKRWSDLIAAFTAGNAEIAGGLNRLWTDQTHWPAGFQKPWSDAADAFIKAAMRSEK